MLRDSKKNCAFTNYKIRSKLILIKTLIEREDNYFKTYKWKISKEELKLVKGK